MRSRPQHAATTYVVLGVLAMLAACGGGGGDSNPPAGGGGPSTTFTGNLRPPSASLAADAHSLGAVSAVQVCVAGTNFCTEVDDTGAFTLDANVGGDVVLVFEGPDFSARLALDNVPRGATVRIRDIVCNTATGRCAAQNVEIVNPANQPPICTAAVARPAVLWPPDHRMVAIEIDGVVDPDGDPVVITATDAVSSESEDAPGSGNTAPDVQLDPLAVRAERSGQGDGRLYTITFTADDGRGGTCNGTVEVCVPHDQGKGGLCG